MDKVFPNALSSSAVKSCNINIGFIVGRSTLVRMGLLIHCTSGLIDNIFDEHRSIIFEKSNIGVHNIVRYSGMAIATLLFCKLNSEVLGNASKQYKGQKEVCGPIL